MLSVLALSLMAPAPKVSAWLVFWNPESLRIYEKNAARLDHVIAEWTHVLPDGTAVRRDDFVEARARAKVVAKKHGNKLLALAANNAEGGFDAKRVQAFLRDPKKRREHVETLVRIVKEDHLDGLDLDYESLEAEDRETFSLFVEELSAAMRKEGKILSIAVHPKESEPGTWGGPQAQDYARIGKVVDVFRIMGYDFSWSTSAPGPISPDDWLERVLRFTVANVPREKVELGIAGYGYDWSKKPATSLTWPDWVKLPGEEKTDERSGERVKGTAHFSGAASNARKLAIAQRFGIRGVCLWYVGSEEPAFWTGLPKAK